MAFLGLFQYTISNAVQNAVQSVNLSTHEAIVLEENLLPLRQASSVTGFLLTSMFVYFFALFKASTLRRNVFLLLLKILALLAYVPILAYCGAILDAIIVAVVIVGRLLYLSYYAWRYKNKLFILLNATTLMFVNGFATYFDSKPFVVLEGGDHYVQIAERFVPFISRDNLYVAIRGKQEQDIQLLRTVELLDGKYIYIFSKCQVVGVTNSCLEEIQLDEYATVSE
uniref:ORF3 protein n=1 Tax=Myotis bat alphacoronavirus TaxID=3027593 RepID=A0AAT9T6E1_9ALPC|nr:MAG: ORF3 protein [Myotis bat alphacoronavirus]